MIVVLAAGCHGPLLQRYEFTRAAMGTQFRVVLYAGDPATAAADAGAALDRVQDLDRRLSDYDEDSEVSRLGKASDRSAPTEWIAVSEDLGRLLWSAQEISRDSSGAFDVTVGPISRLWRRARRQECLPRPEDLEQARARTGSAFLELDPDEDRVRLAVSGMRLDLGGIAKGDAADQALAILQDLGCDRALVDAGGTVRVGRPPPGRDGWSVAIDSGNGPVGMAEIADQAIATSGDRYQFVELGGVRYSHLVDPRTGRALEDHNSATVIARSGWEADALATALCVLAPGEGLELARRRGVRARIEWRRGDRLEWLATDSLLGGPPRSTSPLQSTALPPPAKGPAP